MPPMSCDCAPSPPPDARAANALCPNRRPPRVAVCVVGGARTFVKEQAWRSLRRNLVEGLGGVGLAAGSTAPDVHFHLKTIDDEPKKKQQEWHFDRLDVSRAGVCAAACAFAPTSLELLAAAHAGPAHAAARKRGCFGAGFWKDEANLDRAVSQWSSFAACGASIRRAEAAAGRQYEAVALTRPDLVWYGSVQPFCLQDLTQTTVHRGPAKWNSTLEWLLLMPRNHAESLLATATLFDRCAPGERCCAITRSEDLLLHALNTVGRWRHIPFAIDILRDTHHAGMRNAGCAQPDALGFASTAACKRIVFGQAGGAGEPVSVADAAPAAAPRSLPRAGATVSARVGVRTAAVAPPKRGPKDGHHHHEHHHHAGQHRQLLAAYESDAPLTEEWQPIVRHAPPPPPAAAPECSGGAAPLVAAVLAGPVRSLLHPSVHTTVARHFWRAFGGRHVTFARLFDVRALPPPQRAQLRCALDHLSGELGGEWSAPAASGKALPDAPGCRFAAAAQLTRYPYMVQSLERQLTTLRACYDRIEAYEASHGVRFEWVLRTRTDTAFLAAVRPHCRAPADAVTLAHAYAMDESREPGVHHVFADHAAIVPRALGRRFFVGVAEALARCAASRGQMGPEYASPEAFIHHALADAGAAVASAEWLQPVVVSVAKGGARMREWCQRYTTKYRVAEIAAQPSAAACEKWLLGGGWEMPCGAPPPLPKAT